MAAHFTEILEQALQAQGLASPPAAESGRIPRPAVRPASPAIRLAFSPEARRLSSSLRHYAEDGQRPEGRDSGILTGDGESGYLWKSASGLSGQMRFRTAGGQEVCIRAGSPEEGPSWNVRVDVTCDGRDYRFTVEELGVASMPPVARNLPALASGSPLDTAAEDACLPSEDRNDGSGTVYSSQGSLRALSLQHAARHTQALLRNASVSGSTVRHI